jgi:Replication-relaxation
VRELLSLLSGKEDYTERHYLYRFPLPNTRIGNTEKIYTLGSLGRSYLQSQDMRVDWYFRSYKVASMTYQNCLHALTLTRFLVAAKVFFKTHPAWELTSLRTEYELKQEIAEVQATKQAATISLTPDNGKEHEAVIVVPDAWLQFHNRTSKKGSWHPVFVEIDRASEQQKNFKKRSEQEHSFSPMAGIKSSLAPTRV